MEFTHKFTSYVSPIFAKYSGLSKAALPASVHLKKSFNNGHGNSSNSNCDSGNNTSTTSSSSISKGEKIRGNKRATCGASREDTLSLSPSSSYLLSSSCSLPSTSSSPVTSNATTTTTATPTKTKNTNTKTTTTTAASSTSSKRPNTSPLFYNPFTACPSTNGPSSSSSSTARNSFKTDFYEVLGLPHNCSDYEIRSAYKRLALQYHPDHNSTPEGVEQFHKLNDAYEILCDPDKRKKYDSELRFNGYRLRDLFPATYKSSKCTEKILLTTKEADHHHHQHHHHHHHHHHRLHHHQHVSEYHLSSVNTTNTIDTNNTMNTSISNNVITNSTIHQTKISNIKCQGSFSSDENNRSGNDNADITSRRMASSKVQMDLSEMEKKDYNIEYVIPVTLEELYAGKRKKFRVNRWIICGECHGRGSVSNLSRIDCTACTGKGYKVKGISYHSLSKHKCPSCAGAGYCSSQKEDICCTSCGGSKRVIRPKVYKIQIHPGMASGECILFRGQGDESVECDQQHGDLVFKLSQKPHATFTRFGSNLFARHYISLSDALTGYAEFEMIHLDGRTLRVIYESIDGSPVRNNDIKCIKNEGMPIFTGEEKTTQQRGHLYIQFLIDCNHASRHNMDKIATEKSPYNGPSAEFPSDSPCLHTTTTNTTTTTRSSSHVLPHSCVLTEIACSKEELLNILPPTFQTSNKKQTTI